MPSYMTFMNTGSFPILVPFYIVLHICFEPTNQPKVTRSLSIFLRGSCRIFLERTQNEKAFQFLSLCRRGWVLLKKNDTNDSLQWQQSQSQKKETQATNQSGKDQRLYIYMWMCGSHYHPSVTPIYYYKYVFVLQFVFQCPLYGCSRNQYDTLFCQ